MISWMRVIGGSGVLILTLFLFQKTYFFYYHETPPTIQISGLVDGKSYSQDTVVTCAISNAYALDSVDIQLDGVSLSADQHIGKKKFKKTLPLDISVLPQGKHSMRISAIDGSSHKNKAITERSFFVDTKPLQATLVMSHKDLKVPQGSCLHVQFQVNKDQISAVASVLSKTYPCYPIYEGSLTFETFVPIECDQNPQSYVFSVVINDFVDNKIILEDTFLVESVPFKKKILHVTPNKLKSEMEFTQLQERDLEKALETCTKNSVQKKLWQGAFDVPILMKGISTEFGVIRTSQERGRTIHKALDIVSDPKSVIWSSHDGVVVLKDRFTHSGNTVVIDHGFGLLSLYYHLHDFADIEVGQKVKKGNPVGRMGMTGFANGPHLHWEVRVHNVAVDPMPWTKLVY